MKAHTGGGVVLAALLLAGPAAAQPQDCSRDLLSIDGASVTVDLCVPSATIRRGEGGAVQVLVLESFSAKGLTFARSVPLEFMDGKDTSRTIDDVALEKLGIAKSLHLTIGYRPGSVRLEHAMLVPGAVSLK